MNSNNSFICKKSYKKFPYMIWIVVVHLFFLVSYTNPMIIMIMEVTNGPLLWSISTQPTSCFDFDPTNTLWTWKMYLNITLRHPIFECQCEEFHESWVNDGSDYDYFR